MEKEKSTSLSQNNPVTEQPVTEQPVTEQQQLTVGQMQAHVYKLSAQACDIVNELRNISIQIMNNLKSTGGQK